MDPREKKIIIIAVIAAAALIAALLILSGTDLSGIRIRSAFHIGA